MQQLSSRFISNLTHVFNKYTPTPLVETSFSGANLPLLHHFLHTDPDELSRHFSQLLIQTAHTYNNLACRWIIHSSFCEKNFSYTLYTTHFAQTPQWAAALHRIFEIYHRRESAKLIIHPRETETHHIVTAARAWGQMIKWNTYYDIPRRSQGCAFRCEAFYLMSPLCWSRFNIQACYLYRI
jgi:hypothetical protein